MTFEEILDQAIAMLQRRGRVAYRTLKLQFHLDEEALEVLKEELIEVHHLAVDHDGSMLVWAGEASATSVPPAPCSPQQTIPQGDQPPHDASPSVTPSPPDAERRQLTVMFCDLVDSTRLSGQLDPEDLREVVRAYQRACAEVIERVDGYIAQYLGDGLLVYFGYPQAHEDDAQRAGRAGLGIVRAMQPLNTHLEQRHGVRVAVRLGIHTGLVVVGEVGSGRRQENLALGETPNIAARIQGLAAPDTLAISAATFGLVQGYFTVEALGAYPLRGVAAPVQVYRILGESGAQSRLDAVDPTHLTPLVGRAEEVALMHQRWEQAKTGLGQVVVLSGEAGIGKSRLVQVLKEYVTSEPHARIEWRGSPYHQQSALYPVIDHLHRLLRWHQDDPPPEKLRTLEAALAASGVAVPEAVPLLAALLSLPLPASSPPLTLMPQRQRQQTLDTLLAWLHADARRQPVLLIVENLHWVDPSTLELLSLLIDQSAQARLCLLLTARPEFHPPWAMVAHLTSLTLQRFAPAQVERLATHVAGDKALPPAVLQEMVRRADGVPLFVEELTKTVLESGLLQEREEHYELSGPLPPLAIPATLHDALMARLDRLATVKVVAQLGATLGHPFAYDLLEAVSPLDAATLQRALAQLVEAEVVVQWGLPPQATYTFKHALIQDAAYQSLLHSTRQHYHQRITQVLEERFPDIVETQPELLAYHFTEARLNAQAVPYWQRAGQRASARSAHVEAIAHFTKGLEVLATLPATPEQAQQELELQIALGPVVTATRGIAAPEVGKIYGRARELCQQVGESPQLFLVLWGLWNFYAVAAEFQTARELGEQLFILAQRLQTPAQRMEAHRALGQTFFSLGDLATARVHLEQSIALYELQQHRAHAFRYGQDSGVGSLIFMALSLWWLGYPDQALQRMQEALTLARELAHPLSLAIALSFAGWLHQLRREGQAAQEQAEVLIALADQQGLPQYLGHGILLRGSELVAQGQEEEGMAQMRQGWAAYRTTGARFRGSHFLALLAEACMKVQHVEEGLSALTEALTAVDDTGGRYYEAELYRLKGELLLVRDAPRPQVVDAEASFRQALALARRQQAKSLELRTAMSLSRLWQRQGQRQEAHDLLAPIYGWFTEGFDTADLQEAKALLEALA